MQFANEDEHDSRSKQASHLDLFGPFAIALNPIDARRIGIMPTIYFYRLSHMYSSGPEDLLRRLSEVRQTLIALHIIEECSQTQDIPFRNTKSLKERTSSKSLGLYLNNPKAQLKLERLSRREARHFIDFLQFNRRTFWQLVDRIEYILGLFQDTDSENSPMDYYKQREWRLPLDFQANTVWYSLGNHPKIRNPKSEMFAGNVSQILDLYQTLRSGELSQEILNATWVLNLVDGKPFSQMIKEIICPSYCYNDVMNLVDKAKQLDKLLNSTKVTPI